MIIYEVYDGMDDAAAFFPTRKAAIARAKEMNAEDRLTMAVVTKIEVGKVTRERLCACLMNDGYALWQEVIYPPSEARQDVAERIGRVDIFNGDSEEAGIA